ncbi:hypothetical protein Cgig2_001685 [Carnegiea gigantea]|uniref:Uncharacterized protein n=1 Tax=Carnegiea gigantea TaxID=171969 RepID=A0A9Q1JTE9_9CARY|nr:hypothetical protein Cgig2_001685 [Carnegiea gigantea]
MEVVTSTRPLPMFDYVPTARCEPSHKQAPTGSLLTSDNVREIAQHRINGCPNEERHSRTAGIDARQIIQARQPLQKHTDGGEKTAHVEEATTMRTSPKLHNTRKYCEFHEQNDHTTAKCGELKTALHKLADKGNKTKSLNLEVDFLVVDIPIA